ncbi:MAG: MBL fold metallo-hydrolase [Bacteroidales bacterium]|nr:MBL fold metallo-hydrolase [Bacteroidales bacterium]MBN2632162.1 MBL fold metallo-hydrolase [Bacteroidales bacterium]
MVLTSFSQKPPAYDVIKTSAGNLEMHFIGHGSLMFDLDGFIIHVDPVSSMGSYENKPSADLILVTHEHYDHLDPDLIEKLRKENTLLFTNGNTAKTIKWAQAMTAGDHKTAGIVGVEAVPAYNILHMRAQGQPYHPKGVGIGFILTMGDKRIYVAGDTENTPEMKALKNIDVAFLPMNLPYTMTPEMVADAARAFRPRILYPYHFSETNTDKIVELLKDSNIEVRIRNLK